ncbi:hypothetical protein KUCAC02_036810 [Chaenocephalus aceratus]|nr:hypothetical protein KUCAC02_036810 [Chaenocephalus aceratus]
MTGRVMDSGVEGSEKQRVISSTDKAFSPSSPLLALSILILHSWQRAGVPTADETGSGRFEMLSTCLWVGRVRGVHVNIEMCTT